jgi:hypothetical protein
MKVLSLQCAAEHAFEGWFASEDDFQSQLARGMVECPMCADSAIVKLPSAPRLNLGGHSQLPTASAESSNGDTSAPAALNVPAGVQADHAIALAHAPAGSDIAQAQAAFLSTLRRIVANTEDVGHHFADEARRMHYGDIEARNIRGQATPQQAIDLIEEGIEVMPLPMPAALKETLQ